jgi:hypothetical protein
LAFGIALRCIRGSPLFWLTSILMEFLHFFNRYRGEIIVLGWGGLEKLLHLEMLLVYDDDNDDSRGTYMDSRDLREDIPPCVIPPFARVTPSASLGLIADTSCLVLFPSWQYAIVLAVLFVVGIRHSMHPRDTLYCIPTTIAQMRTSGCG